MNKLMIAATLALSFGAYVNAADCTPTPGAPNAPAPGSALVYDVTVKIKTTQAKLVKGKAGKAGSDCLPGKAGSDDFCYRDTTSKTLNGLIVACTNDCFGFQDSATLTLWNKKEKAVYMESSVITWDPFWRIGKTGQKTELGFSADGDIGMDEIAAQGFGTWKKGRIDKANGSALSKIVPPMLVAKKKALVINGQDECYCVGNPLLCDGNEDDAADFTIGFGTWKMKYNSKASAKFYKDGVLPLPKGYADWDDYATEPDVEFEGE